MDHFRLARLDLSGKPARGELVPVGSFAGSVRHVVTPPRLDRVAKTLTQLFDQRFEVTVSEPTRRGGGPSQADTPADEAESGRKSGGVDRRDALNLPLVRDVFDIFPDATLLDARPERDENQEANA